MSGIEDYDFEQKNRWRRIMWHDIVARLKKSGIAPGDALVLYLAGAQDLDRDCALRKGFRSNNLVAVEMEPEKVAALRGAGVNVIRGDMVDALNHWTYAQEPSVVYADLCANLNMTLCTSLLNAFVEGGLYGRAVAPNGVVVLNFQRGREPDLPVARLIETFPRWFASFARDFGCGESEKHRGLHFLFLMVDRWRRRAATVRVDGVGGDDDMAHALCILRTFSPRLHSYKSGKVMMDSVIFTRALERPHDSWKNPEYTAPLPSAKIRRAARTKRSLAAALAIRTMRGQAI